MEGMNSFMLIFNLVIGAYATYAAIAGKGAAYKNDYPKAVKEKANALLRKFLFIIGPLMLVSSAIEYFNPFGLEAGVLRLISMIAIGLVLALVIAYVVIFRVKYGKALK